MNPGYRTKSVLAFIFAGFPLLSSCATTSEIQEASGIVRVSDDFLIVGDRTPGVVFRVPISGLTECSGGALVGTVTIDRGVEEVLGGDLAWDMEGVGVLPDGTVVGISERLHALLDQDGVVAAYPDLMMELAALGIEGLAIVPDGRIATLLEGGFTDPDKKATYLPGVGDWQISALNPVVCLHRIPSRRGEEVCPDGEGMVVLQAPSPPMATQAFRAPDLVWTTDGQGFIVLLSSTNAADNEFKFKWLQAFDLRGRPVGNPLNLCDRGFLPEELRDGRDGNFEGLDWFEPGESLVLINDYDQPATAVVLDVNPWPSSDSSVACDAPVGRT